MPNYRVSEENHERLRRWAVPLEDSRNDVIRKVLDVAERNASVEQQLQPYAKSMLQEAIQQFILGMDTLPPLRKRDEFAGDLADHILEAWFKGASDGE